MCVLHKCSHLQVWSFTTVAVITTVLPKPKFNKLAKMGWVVVVSFSPTGGWDPPSLVSYVLASF